MLNPISGNYGEYPEKTLYDDMPKESSWSILDTALLLFPIVGWIIFYFLHSNNSNTTLDPEQVSKEIPPVAEKVKKIVTPSAAKAKAAEKVKAAKKAEAAIAAEKDLLIQKANEAKLGVESKLGELQKADISYEQLQNGKKLLGEYRKIDQELQKKYNEKPILNGVIIQLDSILKNQQAQLDQKLAEELVIKILRAASDLTKNSTDRKQKQAQAFFKKINKEHKDFIKNHASQLKIPLERLAATILVA